jgi:hypothetical protein
VRRDGRPHVPEITRSDTQPLEGRRRLFDRDRLLEPRTSLPPRAAGESHAARSDRIRCSQLRRHPRRLTPSDGDTRKCRALLALPGDPARASSDDAATSRQREQRPRRGRGVVSALADRMSASAGGGRPGLLRRPRLQEASCRPHRCWIRSLCAAHPPRPRIATRNAGTSPPTRHGPRRSSPLSLTVRRSRAPQARAGGPLSRSSARRSERRCRETAGGFALQVRAAKSAAVRSGDHRAAQRDQRCPGAPA